ncbi:MAG: hypothetical protein ACK5QX_03830 [bacterium]|jgi:hypothetical protein
MKQKIKFIGLIAAAAFLCLGCYTAEEWEEQKRKEGEACRSRLTNILPGAEMIGYTQNLQYATPKCSATLRFEGKLYFARVEEEEVTVAPLEPMSK